MKRTVGKSIIIFITLFFIDASAAHAAPAAYIDPNTGGMLFQILAVAFTLLSGFIFFFSSRIKMAFARMMRFIREKTSKQVVHEGSSHGSENP